MSKIEKLSPEQEALMAVVREKWINHALNAGDDLDQEKAHIGIEWMYGMTDMKKPRVIYVDSPLAVQYAANILLIEGADKNTHQVRDQVYGQVRDQVYGQVSGQVRGQVSGQVRGQVRDQVYGQVSDQVRGQVYGQVRDQVYGQVSDQVRGQVYDQVYGQVSGQVRDQVYGQVSDQVRDQVYGQKMTEFSWAWENLAWRTEFSFYDFFYQIGVTQHEGLKKYLDYLESGVFFAVFLTDFAIVCRRPKATRRDQNHNLDSDQLPAIEWRDGYKLWFLHGVAFEEEVWKKIISQKITLPELAKMELGADQRAVAIQMLRPDRLLEQMKAKKIATGQKYTKLLEQFGEDYCAANFPWSLNSPTELYEVKNFMDTGETEYCMKMEHPSIKDKFYIEWCPPEVGKRGDADYAQANAFGMTVGEYFNAYEA